MTTPHLQSVIVCNNETAGTGTELDPIRRITTIYSQSGDMLGMEDDLVRFTAKQMIGFVMLLTKDPGLQYILSSKDVNEVHEFIYEHKL